MKSVLNTGTNEVLGFPDMMSDQEINDAISSDTQGRPDVDVNPNFYDLNVRPALEQSKVTGDNKVYYDAVSKSPLEDPFIKAALGGLAFGLTTDKSPEAQKQRELSPLATFGGDLVGQTGSILATAGLADAVGAAKLAKGLGLAVRGATPLEIRTAQLGSEALLPKLAGETIGKTTEAVAKNSMVGALYNGLTQGVDEGKNLFDESSTRPPDVVKVGTEALKGLGWGVYGLTGGFVPKTLISVGSGTAAVAGTAYLLSKAEGHDDADSLLNSAVMGMFHFVSHADTTLEQRQEVISNLQDTVSSYTRAKNQMLEVNNIHELVGKELVENVAKETLREKYQRQLEDFKNSDYRLNIAKQANDLRKAEQTDLQAEMDRFHAETPNPDDQSGEWAVNEIAKNPEDTKEVVRRISDQVIGGQEAQGAEHAQTGSIQKGVNGEAVNGVRNAPEKGVAQPQEVNIPRGTSKIASSIEAKAIEDKLTKGYLDKAGYDRITIKDQTEKSLKLLSDIELARKIIRGEEPLPDGLKATALVTAAEEHIKSNPDKELAAEMAQELVNSPLVSESSKAAQELRLAAERTQDSATTKAIELKKKLVESKGGEEKVTKARKDIVKKAKAETDKINLSKEELSMERFLKEIEC